jgi:hypothetical protein
LKKFVGGISANQVKMAAMREEHFRTRAEMLVSAIQNAKHSYFLTFNI